MKGRQPLVPPSLLLTDSRQPVLAHSAYDWASFRAQSVSAVYLLLYSPASRLASSNDALAAGFQNLAGRQAAMH